ncbi:MAG: hypothetical protein M1816_003423 [Peltula sp. TS41687]|nr:MAG: hypothetical protein M1816_003423 [Peltula sp. TS41687]
MAPLLKTAVALLSLINMAAFASPVPEAAVTKASIFICSGIRWGGQCRNVLVRLNDCTNVPAGWNDRISSIRNDSRAEYKCTWYLDSHCNGQSYDNQDDADLKDGDGAFNGSISSWRCTRN